jgi:hypothetical protein
VLALRLLGFEGLWEVGRGDLWGCEVQDTTSLGLYKNGRVGAFVCIDILGKVQKEVGEL